MDWLMQLLTDADSVGHILLVYSVVIALGMALGRIKVFGISLGVTCVLFVALAVSYAGITVNGTVLNFLRDFGLILFVFFIGLQVGPSFFSSFKVLQEEGYLKNTSGTYFGRALAVIRLTGENGAKISASCAFGSARAEIKRKAEQ